MSAVIKEYKIDTIFGTTFERSLLITVLDGTVVDISAKIVDENGNQPTYDDIADTEYDDYGIRQDEDISVFRSLVDFNFDDKNFVGHEDFKDVDLPFEGREVDGEEVYYSFLYVPTGEVLSLKTYYSSYDGIEEGDFTKSRLAIKTVNYLEDIVLL